MMRVVAFCTGLNNYYYVTLKCDASVKVCA